MQNCHAPLDVRTFTGANPHTPNRIRLTPLTIPIWPTSSPTFPIYHLTDRKATMVRPTSFPFAYMIPTGTCTVDFIGTTMYGDYGVLEKYNFQFSCDTAIPDTGAYVITFPAIFSGATIDTSTCVFGSSSDINAAGGAICSLSRGIELVISGFDDDVDAAAFFDLTIDVTNPPMGSYSNPYKAYQYTIATYDSTTTTVGTFNIIDLNNNADYA